MILTTVKISDLPVKPPGAKRVLWTGDVHLLHPRTSTQLIADNLLRVFTPELNATLDAVYIIGDLWDDSRHLRHTSMLPAIEFVGTLLDMAKTWGWGLRVLEGTPSHDHGQSKHITAMNQGVGADFAYLEGIGIYRDAKLGMTVGYVEDEYRPTARETEDIMTDIFKTQGLSKVDLFAMHGCFHYQLPIFSVRSFTESYWLRRCKYGVYIGHHHRPTLYDRIRATGSPDRLAHGEEHDKGVTVVDYIEGKAYGYFIPNEHACPYRQIKDITDHDELYERIATVLDEMKHHPSAAHGRLKIEYPHTLNLKPNIRQWANEYGFIIEGVQLSDPEKEGALDIAFTEEQTIETITPDNIAELLLAELEDDTYDEDVVMSIMELVK